MNENPYKSPESKVGCPVESFHMTVGKALATMAASTVLFAGLGCLIGYGLGVLAPGYYRSVFTNGNDPWFDPVAVGIGQGLTQGTAGGIVVGLVLVAILTWRDLRLRKSR